MFQTFLYDLKKASYSSAVSINFYSNTVVNFAILDINKMHIVIFVMLRRGILFFFYNVNSLVSILLSCYKT